MIEGRAAFVPQRPKVGDHWSRDVVRSMQAFSCPAGTVEHTQRLLITLPGQAIWCGRARRQAGQGATLVATGTRPAGAPGKQQEQQQTQAIHFRVLNSVKSVKTHFCRSLSLFHSELAARNTYLQEREGKEGGRAVSFRVLKHRGSRGAGELAARNTYLQERQEAGGRARGQ